MRRIALEDIHEQARSDAMKYNHDFSDDADQRVRNEFATPDLVLGHSALKRQLPSPPAEPANLDSGDSELDAYEPWTEDQQPTPFPSRSLAGKLPFLRRTLTSTEGRDLCGSIGPPAVNPVVTLDEHFNLRVAKPTVTKDDIEEAKLQETKRLHRSDFTSSSFGFTAANRRAFTSSSSAVLDTDTTMAERELRRYFGNLNRIHDDVERTGVPWDPNNPDDRRSSPTDPITDTGEVEDITSQMVRCHMRTSSGSHTQVIPAVVMSTPDHGTTDETQSSREPLPRPDNLRRPQDLPLRERGYDFHLLADLFDHDWHVDSADFEHQEKKLGPD